MVCAEIVRSIIAYTTLGSPVDMRKVIYVDSICNVNQYLADRSYPQSQVNAELLLAPIPASSASPLITDAK